MAFGDDKVMQAKEGFTPEAYSWNNAMLQITDGRADTWFQDLNPTPIEDVLTDTELGGQEEREHRSRFAYAFFGENAKNVLPGLEIEFADLGEQRPIEATVIGAKLLKVLEKLGVSWAYNERRAISHENSIEWTNKDEGVAQFQNHFGIPVPQRFRVFVNPDGKETLVWSTELLIATREYLHESERYVHSGDQVTKIQQSAEYLKKGGLSFGRWSERIHLPVFMKSLFFLAETPFPSTALITMPRTIAFKDVPPANMPRPFIYFERNSMAIGPFEKTGNNYNWTGSLFPTVMHGGWLFTNEDEVELETSLVVASNGITAISTIIEDGFHNYQRDDYPAPYDEVLGCAAVLDWSFGNGITAHGRSRWIPGSRIGFLLKDTEIRFHAAVKAGTGDGPRRELWALNDDGAGQFVAAAVNNLAWYFFMPEISKYPEDLPIHERILLQASRLRVKNDSVNCLSNLGILNYMAYKTERAIELFNMVLDDPDDYSDNEALFYLIRIYDQLGETTKAEEYRRRYAEVKPYGWPLQDQIPLSKVSDADTSDSTPKPQVHLTELPKALAQFCGSCGKQFSSDAEKFCGGCGSERKLL